MIHLRVLLFVATFFVFLSCKQEELFYPIEENLSIVKAEPLEFVDFTSDINRVNINTFANANFSGYNTYSYIRNISSANYSYCHPDVIYFPEGKSGFKFWMVFTPFFGILGTNHFSERFENPTVVVSNDGINWFDPEGMVNPLQFAPSLNENMELWKHGKKHGFWSDVDWIYVNGKFHLFFRGSYITPNGYKNRGNTSLNNKDKLKVEAKRRIVTQLSDNGIDWSKLEICYSSNKPHVSQDNLILSPAFIFVNNNFLSYEVCNNTEGETLQGKENSFVLQRKSKDGVNFTNYKQCKAVNFLNRPWKEVNQEFSPWHIDATFIDGFYFLLLNVGPVKKNTGEMVYLAFSKDGINFSVLKKPLIESNGYRSCLFPLSTSTNNDIEFGTILGYKTGEFRFFKFTLNKEKLFNIL